MPNGPGKYDVEARMIAGLTGARFVVLLIGQGNEGSGFSVIGLGSEDVPKVIAMLRRIADTMQSEMNAAGVAHSE